MLLWGKITKYSQYEEMFDALRTKGISVNQMHLMLILASRGDEWTTMQELVNRMQSSKNRKLKVVQSSVSRAIQNLSAKNRYGKTGLNVLEFANEEEAEDGRYVIFRLNSNGKRLVDALTGKL
jgi:DNA-binding MarR family transcriptional regulator